MKVSINTNDFKVFQSFASETRVKILRILQEDSKNIGELSQILGITPTIVARHINLMEKAGIVRSENIPGKRGLQKLCSLATDEIIISFQKQTKPDDAYHLSIPIGHYMDYNIMPTCGLASIDGLIGVTDDTRYFSDPSRINASILWFGSGWIEYRIPSYMIILPTLESIEISLELCSEHPIYKENWPSDIHFYLNDVLLGIWTCPGDFGKKKGVYTPSWWKMGTQYGLLKHINISKKGTKLDGIRFSDVTLEQLNIQPEQDLSFKIAVPQDASHVGGLNIFGKGFGNYNQNIEVYIRNA